MRRWCHLKGLGRCCHMKSRTFSHSLVCPHRTRASFSEQDVLYMDNQECRGHEYKSLAIHIQQVLCVNKPAGLLSQADRTGDTDVLEMAREFVRVATNKPGEAFVALVHRLDRPVSGVMCVARTSKAAARLSASFRTRYGVEKIYHAIVAGKISGSGTREDFLISQGDRGALDCKDGRGPRTAIHRSGPLLETHAATRNGSVGGNQVSTSGGADSSPQPARCSTRPPEAKRAILEWTAIDLSSPGAYALHCRRSGTPLSLLRLRLVTGRKHQIRAQLAGMGYPVVGDVRYGRFHGCGGNGAGSFPIEDRSILLHASGLAMPHPTRPGETVRVVAPPPEAWSKLFGKSVIDAVLADARM